MKSNKLIDIIDLDNEVDILSELINKRRYKMKTKKQIREMLNIKKGGRMQINFHGCGNASILIFKNGVCSEYNIKERELYI